MRIMDRREVVRKEVQEVLIGRRCDVCGGEIVPDKRQMGHGYNFFKIVTHHSDWGNDSVDSFEEIDACCPECVMKFTAGYIQDAYDDPVNTKEIEIEHVRALENGADLD